MTDPRKVALRLMGNLWCFNCRHFPFEGEDLESKKCPKGNPFFADDVCVDFYPRPHGEIPEPNND